MSEKSLDPSALRLDDPLRSIVEATLAEFGESLRSEVSRLHRAAFGPVGELPGGLGSVEFALGPVEPEA
jgi:hypothetical protein